MTSLDIRGQRLLNQHIVQPTLRRPVDVVGWLCAVQAQDYAGAKWSLGLRLQGASDHDIEQAFTRGAILRTHLLRPTWHFVTPTDIRWMLALTAPRVHAVNAYMYRKLELDGPTFKRSNDVLARALEGSKHLTRDELRDVLQKADISTDAGLRMAYLMMRAELDGVICSGPRRGKQFTYALLDERVPPGNILEHEEALAALTQRYFLSRGPARVHDFAKWSGLTVADARRGLEAVKPQLQRAVVEDETYWFSTARILAKDESPAAHLLSVYDEYISSYKGWSLIVNKRTAKELTAMDNALNYLVVVDGQLVGAWKRLIRRDAVIIKTTIFTQLTESKDRAVAEAAHRYGNFLGLPVMMA
jgi:hypothetical protein